MFLRALAAAALLAVSGVAAAQDSSARGSLGPYRFGMSGAEVRATAPDAAWVSRRSDGGVILTGGPLVEVGAPLNASLVLSDDQLRRIVLAGIVSSDCAAAVSLMVGALEPTYGAFSSVAPPAIEQGALRRVMRTDGGSEVRIRETGRDRINEVVSANYGDGHVVVHGRTEDTRCQLTITFGTTDDWRRSDGGESPTWAQLQAAPRLEDPNWARRPNAYTYTRAYPQDALDAARDGSVTLDCLVLERGALSCVAVEETPPGEGFAVAALQIARDYRVRRGRDGQSAIGKRVRVQVPFNADSP